MEPRARAGKNVGKVNFPYPELGTLLWGNGDVSEPLPETMRVLDEILTEFIQSVSFEASRAAHYSGRQKIKCEDFEFAFRKNAAFLGRMQESFEKQKAIKKIRSIAGEDGFLKEAIEEEKKKEKVEKSEAKKSAPKVVEELNEADDDADAEADALGTRK